MDCRNRFTVDRYERFTTGDDALFSSKPFIIRLIRTLSSRGTCRPLTGRLPSQQTVVARWWLSAIIEVTRHRTHHYHRHHRHHHATENLPATRGRPGRLAGAAGRVVTPLVTASRPAARAESDGGAHVPVARRRRRDAAVASAATNLRRSAKWRPSANLIREPLGQRSERETNLAARPSHFKYEYK